MKNSLLLCLLAATVCFAAEIEVNVNNVTALVGEEVRIPCEYTADVDINPKITWYTVFDDNSVQRLYVFKKGVDHETYADASTNRQGLEIDSNDGSLVIPKANITDNKKINKLRCSVDMDKAGSAQDELTFTVLLFPEKPATTLINAYTSGETGFTMTDFKVSIGSCTSSASYPAATVTFYKNGQMIETGNEISVLTDLINIPLFALSKDGMSMTTEDDLMKKLDPTDHQAEFVCNVKTVFGDRVFERNYTMPKFNVNYDTTEAKWEATPTAYLGETITLKCIANGYPEPSIMINGVEEMEREITVTEALSGTQYQCSATNNPSNEAVRSEIYTIEVISLKEPVIVGEKKIMEGDSVTFTCTAEGNPTPTVSWYKGEDKMSDTGSLTIEKASFEDSAEYMCKAENGHETLKRSSTIDLSVRGLKLKGEAEEALTGKKDDTLTLECEVTSNPSAKFTWNIDDAKFTEVKSGHTYTSQLSIGPLTTEMSEKVYVCKAENDDGVVVEKSFTMPVIAEASTATAGIIIAILLVVLIVAIILAVLYNKGIICRKAEKGDESAEGDIAVEINNEEADVEAGNGKPAAHVEETEPLNDEEEKLMNGENTED